MIPLPSLCFKVTRLVRMYIFIFQIQVYQEVNSNARDAVINLVSSLLLVTGFLSDSKSCHP